MLRLRWFILFIGLIYCGQLISQEPPNSRFLNFGSKDGLTEKYIYSITQDKKGYIWLGTGTGLFRYDGINFTVTRSPLDKNGSTISNILQAIYTDPTGNLWLGSLNDLQCYDPRTNHFWRPGQKDSSFRKLGSHYITRFSPGAENEIYIQTFNSFFYRFNPTDSSLIDFAKAYPRDAPRNTIKVLEEKDAVLAVHINGIYRFSHSGKFEGFFPFPYKNDEITNAARGNEGVLLTSYVHGLLVFDPVTGRYSTSSYNQPVLEKNNLLSLLEKNGECWIGSYPLFCSKANGSLLSWQNTRTNEYELTASKIGDLFFDRENNLWICSHNGLSMLPWQNQQIRNIELKEKGTNNQIEPTGVFGIPGSKDLLITNTSTAGLVYYEASKGSVSVMTNPVEKDPQARRIIGLLYRQDGSIYASDDKQLFAVDLRTRSLKPFVLQDQDGKPLRMMGRNVIDKKGKVWISSINNGFYTWEPVTNKLTHYNKTVADPRAVTISDNTLYPCIADSRNHIWFTSLTGVYELDQINNKWTWHNAEGLKNIPPITQTIYIAEDRLGHIWVSTQNNGLYEIVKQKDSTLYYNYGKNSGIGLSTDYCNKMKLDKKSGLLWLSTINGLHRFDPVNKRILSSFTVQNGLARDGGGYTFNITEEGQLVNLYYGAASIIDLNSFRYNTDPPVVEFTSLRVMDKEVVYELDTSKALELDHNRNFLEIGFAALQFNNHNQLQYAYQLEGADKDWIYSGNRNEVTYSGLAPGTYVFKVKAANNDGVWSTTERWLRVVVLPPFWKTPWFIAVCAALLAAGLWLLYRLRMKSVRREEQMKNTFHQRIADMEMRALRAQMNPHFIFNSLNSIQKYILKNDHFAASQYLTKFSRLIRLILDHSNQNNILLASEAELLRLYCEMESLRFDQRFEYSIDMGPALQPDTVEIPSMLIQPYVENAIWHGLLHKDSVGRLQIRFEKNAKGHLLVTIEDDGVGRKKAMELKSKQVLKKKSYGMQITEDRIALINRLNHIQATSTITDLYDEQGQATGTRVVLEIPQLPVS